MGHIASVLPGNAPFSPAQQAWLNGLLAGLLGSGEQPAAISSIAMTAMEAVAAAQAPELHGATPAPAQSPVEPEDFPWHDPTLSLDQRLALAEGRLFPRKLMAAMAQFDCGQCGYLCQTYAEAIASGEERALTRCVPGGKETARMLRELMAVGPVGPPPSQGPLAPIAAPVVLAPVSPAPVALSPPPNAASAPVHVRFAQAAPLNRKGSEKDTRHVVFRFEDVSFDFEVGDSLGVHVTNEPTLVDAIIERLGAPAVLEVDCPDGSRRSLREVLLKVCDIGRPIDQAIEVLASRARDHDEADRLQALAEGYPGAEPEDADILDLLLAFPSAQPPVQELISALGVLQPRLYSIASSPKARPGEVHLTVAAVRYRRRGRLRKGIASVYLAERAKPGSAVPVFVKPAQGFGLPEKRDAPIIMIGPGTGIAPFRAFLEERRETGASGKNWLFFGDQRRATDFLYEEELSSYLRDGLLTHLDVAFSRDQAEKLYVQHRMRARARELWAWLQEGAHLYVCGDATRMARDVEMALAHIIAKQGGMELSAAKAHLAGLAREGRYQRDVY